MFTKKHLSIVVLSLCAGAAWAQTPAGIKALEIQGSVKVDGLPENYDSITVTCRVGEPGLAQQQQKMPLTLSTACKGYGQAGFTMVLQANNTPLPAKGTYVCDLTFHSIGGYVIAQNAAKVFNAPRQTASVSGSYTSIARGSTPPDRASVSAPLLQFSGPNKCKP
jgi:hypothetical protein